MVFKPVCVGRKIRIIERYWCICGRGCFRFPSHLLFVKSGEKKSVAREVGVRLGQASEFSLLVGSIALSTKVISAVAANLIQAATILTFVVSSYWVVLKYPTPM